MPGFRALKEHFAEIEKLHMREIFAQEPDRFDRFSVEAAGVFLDYSKNRLTAKTMQLLFSLARARGLEERRQAMFAGEKINATEDRAAMHVALRARRSDAIRIDGHDVNADVHGVLDRIEQFSERVRSGEWRGYDGSPITDIVNIGIGGSDLGPKMACKALRSFGHPHLSMHFVSNADGHDLDAVLQKVSPASTLFIVASKTFTTLETMMNAHAARNWFSRHAKDQDLPRHFVAVSTNTEAVQAFGIDVENMFPFWDWVGGRYSIWSAIGLPIALYVGFSNFRKMLDGGHAMDEHFRNAPLEKNLPVILGLIGLWYRNFFGASSVSVAPYHQDLSCFPAYLQQLEMESNGKRVAIDGSVLDYSTCPVIWGDIGTNGQHAYFQLLHQGTDVIPVDFIAALQPSHAWPEHQVALLANCFAQSEAFMRGKTADEVRADLQAANMSPAEIEVLTPHKVFPGNRPSNTILLDALTPETLGALIALYEHKVFAQGVLWGVNSFDQWGVELGKVLAKSIMEKLNGAPVPGAHDSSTNGLIARARAAIR